MTLALPIIQFVHLHSCIEVETGDSLLSAPWCQIDSRLSQSWKKVFQARKSVAIRITSSVWMAPVWKWWVCKEGQCPIAYSTVQDCAVLTPVGPSLTSREPKWRSKFSTATRMVMSLCLDPYVLLLCHTAQGAAGGSKWNESIKYQKFEVCSVDISKDLNNVILIGGKHLVTSIVMLSAEKQAPCHRHTYASRTYKVVRPKITEWQSTPVIHSLTCVSILNIFILKGSRELLKSTLTASLSSQRSSLINHTN